MHLNQHRARRHVGPQCSEFGVLVRHVNRASQGHFSNAAIKAIDVLRWLPEYLLPLTASDEREQNIEKALKSSVFEGSVSQIEM